MNPSTAVLLVLDGIIGLLLLAVMVAVIGLHDRVKKIETKDANNDPDPIKSFIVDAQELQARLIREEEERLTSADE